MNKKKVLKIIGIIVLIAFIIFLVHTIRNYIIITNLQNKISKYSDSTNYYTKFITTENNGTIVTMQYYKKDDKQVVFLERNLNGEITKISMYDNGKRTDTFTETKDSKIANLDNGTLISVNIYNFLETDNNLQTLIGSMCAKIKTTEYDGKKCYVINDFLSPMALSGIEKNEVYIEKETGLYLKSIIDSTTTKREFEFDNVDDSIFVEPDIGQYTLEENN